MKHERAGRSLMRPPRIAFVLLLLVATSAFGQTPMVPTQQTNSKNQQVASSTNAAAVITLTAPTHSRAHLYSVKARCSAGTSTITITDGGTTIWSSAAGFVTTTDIAMVWMPALTGSLGANVVITLATCGGGNVGTLTAQADVY